MAHSGTGDEWISEATPLRPCLLAQGHAEMVAELSHLHHSHGLKAICITPGARQFLYVSNSNPPNNLDYDGEILKMTLDGRIVGKFGRAGKLLKEFGTVNSIDCRSENELYVGELGNWRVQRVTLKPAAGAK